MFVEWFSRKMVGPFFISSFGSSAVRAQRIAQIPRTDTLPAMASYFFKSNARDDKDSALHTSAGSTPARSAIHLSVDGGLRCTRYAPPPAARTWYPPAPCVTSAGKPRTSAARAAAIHTPRKPTGSHGHVCWRGIRDASAQATDLTDAAGTMACAAPPVPSPTIGRSNASSSSKPD